MQGLLQDGKPAVAFKLPWGGVAALLQPGADASALRLILEAAVLFASHWRELSSMDRHTLYESMLEASAECGISVVNRPIDLTSEDDPIPSFLRSIGKRYVLVLLF